VAARRDYRPTPWQVNVLPLRAWRHELSPGCHYQPPSVARQMRCAEQCVGTTHHRGGIQRQLRVWNVRRRQFPRKSWFTHKLVTGESAVERNSADIAFYDRSFIAHDDNCTFAKRLV